MKKMIIYCAILFVIFSCNNETQAYYELEDSEGKKISFYGTAEVGKDKYLANYDDIGFKDLVDINGLPKRDTLIVRRYSKRTGEPVATLEIKKFRVIAKK